MHVHAINHAVPSPATKVVIRQHVAVGRQTGESPPHDLSARIVLPLEIVRNASLSMVDLSAGVCTQSNAWVRRGIGCKVPGAGCWVQGVLAQVVTLRMCKENGQRDGDMLEPTAPFHSAFPSKMCAVKIPWFATPCLYTGVANQAKTCFF